jgi:geranylgeranyl pyrophosphate synthase
VKALQANFRQYLHQSASEIEQELIKFSQGWNDAILNGFPEIKKPNKRFTKIFFGGKMLRGTLVMLGFTLVETKPSKAIVQPAAAWEILHSALLVHDDIIDQCPMRRGKPAMHIVPDKSHYGLSQAICLGDLGITLAIKMIADSNFLPERKNLALHSFLSIITDTVLGQMLDVESTHSLKRSATQVYEIQLLKTALYTFVGPLSVGAILGGASSGMLKTIKLFGEKLGVAYQIQDDILGIFGDEKMLGKSTASDIEENKSTLLITYSLAHATQKQHMYLTKYYGKKGLTFKQQEKIKKIMRDTGAVAYSQNKIETLTNEAKAFIPQLAKEKTKQILLTELADALITRQK